MTSQSEGCFDSSEMGVFQRVERLGRAKQHNLEMVAFIGEQLDREEYNFDGFFNPRVQKLYERMGRCASWLTFRHYTEHNKNRLTSANFCGRHLLCQACAIRRGAQKLQAYTTRVEYVLKESPKLKPWLITLTVKNGDDLLERFDHLMTNFKRMQKQRSKRLQGASRYLPTEFEKIDGAVFSYEVPKSKDGERWHPHIHMLALCSEKPDAGFVDPKTGEGHGLCKEWFDLTGDSFMIDVRSNPEQPVIEMAMEVMKYAVKFTSQSPADTWKAFQVLNGRRLFGSFGSLHGVKLPKSLLEAPLTGPFIEYVFKYHSGGNYEKVSVIDHSDIYDLPSDMGTPDTVIKKTPVFRYVPVTKKASVFRYAPITKKTPVFRYVHHGYCHH
ncbi:MAG: protein rep [Mariprofundaceae bacterium]|nr:protein rep [Mariprofundaceae bacterium]